MCISLDLVDRIRLYSKKTATKYGVPSANVVKYPSSCSHELQLESQLIFNEHYLTENKFKKYIPMFQF
jgi:hypothetical protein